jgi:uncharacterized membrane protein
MYMDLFLEGVGHSIKSRPFTGSYMSLSILKYCTLFVSLYVFEVKGIFTGRTLVLFRSCFNIITNFNRVRTHTNLCWNLKSSMFLVVLQTFALCSW